MKTKKILIILLIMTVIIAMFTTVKAAEGDSYKITLAPTAGTAKQGETVTIKIKASDIKIQSGEKGIGAYQGTLAYDTEVFESASMTASANWDTPMLNEGGFTSVRGDGECTSEAQDIGVITLKVKSNAKVVTGKVEITDFSASNGVEMIPTIASIVANVTIESASTGNPGTNASTPSTPSTPSTGSSTTKYTSTTKSGTLPKTGVSGVLVTVIGIIAIGGIASYIGYKRTY